MQSTTGRHDDLSDGSPRPKRYCHCLENVSPDLGYLVAGLFIFITEQKRKTRRSGMRLRRGEEEGGESHGEEYEEGGKRIRVREREREERDPSQGKSCRYQEGKRCAELYHFLTLRLPWPSEQSIKSIL